MMSSTGTMPRGRRRDLYNVGLPFGLTPSPGSQMDSSLVPEDREQKLMMKLGFSFFIFGLINNGGYEFLPVCRQH
jgi:hypothetical protein